MLSVLSTVRRIIGGSIVAIVLVALVAVFGGSTTVDELLADAGPSSVLFLIVVTVVLADLIAKMIGILGKTFPDIIPKLEQKDFQIAALIQQFSIGKAIGVLAGAKVARVVTFALIFAALGWSYASAPAGVQDELVGSFDGWAATGAFIREGIAGSLGYFLFFLGPDALAPIKASIIQEPLSSSTIDGNIFLSGIRLYGLAFVFAIAQALVTPIIFLRARLRARLIQPDAQESA